MEQTSPGKSGPTCCQDTQLVMTDRKGFVKLRGYRESIQQLGLTCVVISCDIPCASKGLPLKVAWTSSPASASAKSAHGMKDGAKSSTHEPARSEVDSPHHQAPALHSEAPSASKACLAAVSAQTLRRTYVTCLPRMSGTLCRPCCRSRGASHGCRFFHPF